MESSSIRKNKETSSCGKSAELENVDDEEKIAKETFSRRPRVVNDSGSYFLPVLARQKWISSEVTIRLNCWRRQIRLEVTAGFSWSPLKRARSA